MPAIIQKQLGVIRYLLNQVENIDAIIIMAAVKAESIPIFEILFEHGWDVNAPLGFGHTPLVNLLHNEQLARWLLAHGVDPNLDPPFNAYARSDPITNSGNTLDVPAAMSNPAFFDLLPRHCTTLENCAPLHSAVEGMGNSTDGGRIPMMEHLLRLSLDINDFDECRGGSIVGTPLHCAIRQGAVDKVRFSVRKGSGYADEY
ncbi:hypothetical protein OEA41_009271 [Lepraria neglecta]|uniref:Ankyrin n=1 Tax=Lepraria neglecta TaxID=209136 RepID=A0AAE0DGQ2_9LECA|nr:hypothetical protein OEA41_009271 [Lepraria neglecta]